MTTQRIERIAEQTTCKIYAQCDEYWHDIPRRHRERIQGLISAALAAFAEEQPIREQILAKTEELGWAFQEPFINHLDVIIRRRRRGLNETQLKFWMAVADERQLQEAYDDTINLLKLMGEIPLEP